MDLTGHAIVAVIRNDRGEFLLLEEARESMQGHWAPPHGRCDSTDTSEEGSVAREVLEETGLAVQATRKLLTQAADTKATTVSFWQADLTAGYEVTIDPTEASGHGWFSLDEALGLRLFPGTKIFFDKVKSGEIKLI